MPGVDPSREEIAVTGSAFVHVKVNLGCGGDWKVAGWIGLDRALTLVRGETSNNVSFLDVDARRGLPFATNSVDVVFCSHTLEHFTYEERTLLLFDVYRVLKVGAPFCLVVPDMDLFISSYLARNHEFLTSPAILGGAPRRNLADNFLMNFYSDPKFNGACHKYAYNFENLSSALLDTGFGQIEKVTFHDFSYWPELRETQFQASKQQLETVSLSVQCRKLEFDTNYSDRPAFKEALRFARFGDNEQQLKQQLNAAFLLNEALHAELARTKAQLNTAGERTEVPYEYSPPEEPSTGLESQRSSELNSSDARQLQMRLDTLLRERLESDRALRSARARLAASKGINGLVHYLREGASKGLTPSPEFDGNWYLTKYPDVAATGANPLVHYVRFGASEGRATAPGSSIQAAKENSQFFRVKLFNDADPDLQLSVSDDTTLRVVEMSKSDSLDGAEIVPGLYSPLITIVVLLTRDSTSTHLNELVDSIRGQSYPTWEFHIVHDSSSEKTALLDLEHIRELDARIKLHPAAGNVGTAVAFPQIFQMAAGEYVAVLNQHTVLAPNAFFEVVQSLRNDPSIELIYTDHASLNEEGVISSPSLKPAWSPEFFLSTNFLEHFVLFKRSLVDEIRELDSADSAAWETALTWKVAERESSIHHIPKVLHYHRMPNGSDNTFTKKASQEMSVVLEAHNEHLNRQSANAAVIWPHEFRDVGARVYKLEFSEKVTSNVAVIVPGYENTSDLSGFVHSLKKTAYPSLPPVHFIGKSPVNLASDTSFFHPATEQEEFDQIVEGIDCEILVFISPGAFAISQPWLRELVGYLSVARQIGAVGGKILNDRLAVRAGGFLLINNPQPISLGASDENDGSWFRNRIASNVEAVSLKLMATRKEAYRQAGGLPVYRYGDAAGIPYCLRLRAAGYRVVYNPWSKIVDTAQDNTPPDVPEMLAQDFASEDLYDRYYHPFFSRDVPYAL